MGKKTDIGPGSYKIMTVDQAKEAPKGNYPPIFGSGVRRFDSAPKTTNDMVCI